MEIGEAFSVAVRTAPEGALKATCTEGVPSAGVESLFVKDAGGACNRELDRLDGIGNIASSIGRVIAPGIDGSAVLLDEPSVLFVRRDLGPTNAVALALAPDVESDALASECAKPAVSPVATGEIGAAPLVEMAATMLLGSAIWGSVITQKQDARCVP